LEFLAGHGLAGSEHLGKLELALLGHGRQRTDAGQDGQGTYDFSTHHNLPFLYKLFLTCSL
jgi:hypothetical protein